jgi:hypothetical protein
VLVQRSLARLRHGGGIGRSAPANASARPARARLARQASFRLTTHIVEITLTRPPCCRCLLAAWRSAPFNHGSQMRFERELLHVSDAPAIDPGVMSASRCLSALGSCQDRTRSPLCVFDDFHDEPARMLAGIPAPWNVVETTGEFIVKDASGRALAYFYWWGDGTTALLTRDEARCPGGRIFQNVELSSRQLLLLFAMPTAVPSTAAASGDQLPGLFRSRGRARRAKAFPRSAPPGSSVTIACPGWRRVARSSARPRPWPRRALPCRRRDASRRP